MAKAAVCVNNCSASNGTVTVNYDVSLDSGPQWSSATTANFLSSVTQMNNQIRSDIVTQAMNVAQVTLAVTDVTLFGGAS